MWQHRMKGQGSTGHDKYYIPCTCSAYIAFQALFIAVNNTPQSVNNSMDVYSNWLLYIVSGYGTNPKPACLTIANSHVRYFSPANGYISVHDAMAIHRCTHMCLRPGDFLCHVESKTEQYPAILPTLCVAYSTSLFTAVQ